MNIQRFIGSDSRTAMRKVRQALGDDALILSNRQVADGIEIIAADGNDEMLFGESNNAIADHVSDETESQPSYTVQTELAETQPDSPEPPMPSLADLIKTEKLAAEISTMSANGSEASSGVAMPNLYTGLGAADPQPAILEPVIPGNQTTKNNSAAVAKAARFEDSINQAKTALRASNKQPMNSRETESDEMNVMRQELTRLRGMMENQFSNMHLGLWAKSSPARATVLHKMTELGLTEMLATKIVGSLKNIETATPQVSARDALATLAKLIRVTGDKITEQGGTIVFIGPAGAGKTTTIAKLALQFTQQHGKDDIVLISTDTSRFGAHEQLAAYGRLLGVPVLRATENDQIRELISAMQGKKLVLVDTAGLTQQDLRSPDQIPTMALQLPNIQHYLVLPATAQYQTLDRVISSLSSRGVAGAIMTKLDEAANLGELLSSAITNKLPISYWTEESKITSALHIASPRRLVEKAVSVLRTQARHFSNARTTNPNNQNQNIHHQQS